MNRDLWEEATRELERLQESDDAVMYEFYAALARAVDDMILGSAGMRMPNPERLLPTELPEPVPMDDLLRDWIQRKTPLPLPNRSVWDT